MDGPGPLIELLGPHEEISNSDFMIWLGGGESYICCIPIRIHYLWISIGIIQNRLEQLSILHNYLDMRQYILVPVIYVMADLMLVIKESEVKLGYILVHIHQ